MQSLRDNAPLRWQPPEARSHSNPFVCMAGGPETSTDSVLVQRILQRLPIPGDHNPRIA